MKILRQSKTILKKYFLRKQTLNSNFPTSSCIHIRLGEHNIPVNEGTEQWTYAAKMIKHQQHNSLDNDIMLSQLSHPATHNRYVQTVVLPSRCPVADENCLVFGWGNASANSSKLSLKGEERREGMLDVSYWTELKKPEMIDHSNPEQL